MVKVVQVQSEEDITWARGLFVEYAESLGFSLCFQSFDKEVAGLPGEYGKPEGRLFLAFEAEETVGCAGLRKIDEDVCEMKRLYVRPRFRRKGIGRTLAMTVIEEAHRIGYKHIRLDTTSSMREAINLYHSLGFKQTKPYRYNPIEGAMYMELVL